jgi:hypothetical protein
MSAMNSKGGRALFALLTASLLAMACSSEATGPSQASGSSDGSSVVQSDSTRPSFGWRGG